MEVLISSSYTTEQVLFDAALASKHGDAIDDAIDIAIIGSVRDAGQEDELLTYAIERFVPFDPVSKRTEAYVRATDGRKFKVSKGAPQVVSISNHTQPSQSLIDLF
jgi:H+-transporting ATPase